MVYSIDPYILIAESCLAAFRFAACPQVHGSRGDYFLPREGVFAEAPAVVELLVTSLVDRKTRFAKPLWQTPLVSTLKIGDSLKIEDPDLPDLCELSSQIEMDEGI